MTLSAPLAAADLTAWLYGEAVRIQDGPTLVSATAERLRTAGVPVERIMTGITILHPNVRTEAVTWTIEAGAKVDRYLETEKSLKSYENSPMQVVYTQQRSVRIRLSERTGLPGYSIVPDLLEAGYTDYLALPLPFSDGSTKGITFATRDPGGFLASHVMVMEALAPPLALICELQTLKRMGKTLLDTYVGPRAGARVLSGAIKRGDGETISAVVGFVDLRGFTHLSNVLPGDRLVALLNDYFEAVDEAVVAHGGEVLKFIGDEVMAVFPHSCEQSAREAARQALLAARDVVRRIGEISDALQIDGEKLRVGMALHAGDVFFGNVGAQTRLDFTVVGPAVNLASRLAGLTRDLDHDILVSETIADMIGCRAGYLGAHSVRGFDEPVAVFTPPVEAIGADGSWCGNHVAMPEVDPARIGAA
jgi:adenylate cyclase